MRRNRPISVLAVLAALGGAAAPAAAQERIELRYRPEPGALVRTVAVTDFTMTVGGGDPLAAVESLAVGVEIIQSVTERVLEAGPTVSVERTLDSTRLTVRRHGEARSEPPDPSLRASARVRLDQGLRVEAFDLTAPDGAIQLVQPILRSPAGGYGLRLPDGPVSLGDEWMADVSFPFSSPIGPADAPAGLPFDTILVARARFTLDSLVYQGVDTLAYITVRGRFAPFTMSQRAAGPEGVVEGSVTMAGGFGGSVIWSIGWNAWGSGVIHTTIDAGFSVASKGETGGASVRFDVMNRFGLRP